ncbi:MAG TPA: hypothetical protein DER07_00615 [Armatimonadetes bacterium]|nr:hypothetical protein [Armatimonadota bacterium]
MKTMRWFAVAVVLASLVASAPCGDDLLGRSRGRDNGGGQERSKVDERTRGGDQSGRVQPPIQDRSRGDDRVRGGDRERTLPPIQDRARGGDPGDRSQPPIQDRSRGEDRARGGDRERTLPPIQDRARGEDVTRRGREDRGSDGPPRVIVGPYGVVDPQSRDRNRNDLLGRTRDSGSRSVYGTVTNARANVVDIRELQPTDYRRAPIDLFKGSLGQQARRESVELRTERLRIGYVHYDSRWRDDDFIYAFYEFRPIPGRCTVSPWYYYPHLPGYVRAGRVILVQPVVSIYFTSDRFYYYPWRDATPYVWSRPIWVSDRYHGGELDWALDDLVSIFERRDRRALDRLVPRYGRVGIWIDEDYAYSLGPDDFYDMLLDNAFGTRTRRYDIVDVRRWRDQVRVLARHDYEDPWGRSDTVYHTYRLERQDGRYVIVDFGTSAFRPRF